MDNQVYMNTLYDYYGSLLTEKQQTYFEEYYFNNLTITEISENYNISRNAVHKQLKEIENKLLYYEDKLNLDKKAKEIYKLINNLDEKTKERIKELV